MPAQSRPKTGSSPWAAPRHMGISAAFEFRGPPRGRVSTRDRRRSPLRAACLPEPHGQEPDPPLEPGRPLLDLRRHRDPDPHQLGSQDGARRRGRDHLLERAGPSARPDRPELRAHRPGRDDPVLAGARTARPRARLQVHRPARLLGASARYRRHPVREGLELDGRARADPRPRMRADDDRADRGAGRVLRAGCASSARGRRGRDRDPRLQRVPDHPVPVVRRSTTEKTSTAARWRTGPGSRSRSCGPSARRSGTTSISSSRSARSTTTTRSSPGRRRATRSRSRSRSASGSSGRESTPSTSPPARRSRTPGIPPEASRSTDVVRGYDTMISSGRHTFRNYLMFRTWPVNRLFKWLWERRSKGRVEGINLPESRAIKQAVSVPVVCTGGFQTASVIAARDRARRLRRRDDRAAADREPRPGPCSGRRDTTGRLGHARTRTSASSTRSRTRSAATT